MRSTRWFPIIAALLTVVGCSESTEVSEVENRKLKNDFQTSIKSIEDVPPEHRDRVRRFMEAAKRGPVNQNK